MNDADDRATLSHIPSRRAAARAILSDLDDPAMGVDLTIATFMATALWIIGGTIVVLLLLVAPPTQAVGWAGWLPAALMVALCFYLVLRRSRSEHTPTVDELLVGSCLAVIGIGLLEWLAGGREAPYHHLFMFPVMFAAAVQPRGRVLLFLMVLTLALGSPIAYEGFTSSDVLDIATQLVLLVALGVAARLLFAVIRAQRAGLRGAREKADELARRDGLTGLGNRLALEERLDLEIARVRRSGDRLSLVVGDLDAFKRINDELGHAGGDDCLRRVAEALRRAARTADECFRWGGDEFALILPRTNAAEARLAADRISTEVEGACVTGEGHPLGMTCGAAELVEGQDREALLEAADRGLIERKRAGGRGESEAGLTIEAGSGGSP